MSQDLLGADVGGLQEIARDCEKAAKTADTVRMILQAIVAAARMFGPWSEAFVQYLSTVVIPWLAKVAQALRMFARVLNAFAQAQIRVSNGEDVNFDALPRYVSPIAPIGDTPPGSAPPSDPVDDSTSDDDSASDDTPAAVAPAPVAAAPAPASGGGSGGGWPGSAMRPLPELPELEPLDLDEEEEEAPEEINQEMAPIIVQAPDVVQPGVGLGAMLGGLAAAAAGGGLLGAAVTYGVQKKMAKQDADDGSNVLGRASFDQPRRP